MKSARQAVPDFNCVGNIHSAFDGDHLNVLGTDWLIATKGENFTILDLEAQAAIAGFNELYFHTDGSPVEEKLRIRVATSE